MSITSLIIIFPFLTLQITAVHKYIFIIFQIVCIQLTENIGEFTLLSCICGVGSLLLVSVSKFIFPKASPLFLSYRLTKRFHYKANRLILYIVTCSVYNHCLL